MGEVGKVELGLEAVVEKVGSSWRNMRRMRKEKVFFIFFVGVEKFNQGGFFHS